MQIESLEALPRAMVGDGGTPNVFFVSQHPQGVMMVTRDFDAARRYWRSLPRNVETCLEDRKYGVICSTEPRDEDDPRLVTHDDSDGFRRMYKSNS